MRRLILLPTLVAALLVALIALPGGRDGSAVPASPRLSLLASRGRAGPVRPPRDMLAMEPTATTTTVPPTTTTTVPPTTTTTVPPTTTTTTAPPTTTTLPPTTTTTVPPTTTTTTVPAPESLWDVVQLDPDLTEFAATVQTAGLVGLLEGSM